MNKKNTIIILVVLIVAVAGIFFLASSGKKYKGTEVTFYKSFSCGCCGNYFPYLKKYGFRVKIIEVEDINEIKNQYGVPENSTSCHTTIIGNYFVEGHVPMEAIDKLLQEKPDIDGISLPNMPAGSPGMLGQKSEEFIILQIKNGNSSEFMRI